MRKEAICGAYGDAEALLRKLAYLASFAERQYQSFCFHWGEGELSPEQEQKLFDDLRAARGEVGHQLAAGVEGILAAIPLLEGRFRDLADRLELAYSELGDIEIPGFGSCRVAWPMLRDVAGRVRVWAGSYGSAFGAGQADPRFIRDLADQCPFNHSIEDLIHRRLLLEKSRLLRDFGDQKREISVVDFAERLMDSHRRIERFKEDTGFDPPEDDRQWFAWGFELFGKPALELSLVGLQNLIYGKLRLEKERGNPDSNPIPPGDGIYPDEKCFVWGGKRFDRLTPKMLDVLKVFIDQYRKGFPVVSLNLIKDQTGCLFDGSFANQAFKQNRKGEPKVHPVIELIKTESPGSYRLIDPLQSRN